MLLIFGLVALFTLTCHPASAIVVAHQNQGSTTVGIAPIYLEDLNVTLINADEAVVMNKFIVTLPGQTEVSNRIYLYSPVQGWAWAKIDPVGYYSYNTDPGMVMKVTMFTPFGTNTAQCKDLAITGRSAKKV